MLRRLLFLTALPLIAQCQQTAIKPTTTIRLFDGKTLDNFDLWQQDNHESDPDKVFSVVDQVDGAPATAASCFTARAARAVHRRTSTARGCVPSSFR